MHNSERSGTDVTERRQTLAPGGSERHASEECHEDASPVQTIQIIFKGLMVFHNNKAKNRFEAGILNVEGHTFTVTVIAESTRMRREVLLDKIVLRGHEMWE